MPGSAQMFVGKPTKGYKTSTIVVISRRHRSKWWEVVCYGPKRHYRPDGSCAHTDEALTLIREDVRSRVRVVDGRERSVPG